MCASPPDARIICIGNRFAPGDDAGCRVHDVLAAQPLPAGVELIDGGLGGLNLLTLFEGCSLIVVCDAASGFGPPGSVHLLSGQDLAPPTASGHAGGLAELLAVLPQVIDGPVPKVAVVAVELPADTAGVDRAAAMCRRLLADGGTDLLRSGG